MRFLPPANFRRAAAEFLLPKLGLTLPLDGPKTLNGLILEHFQDIPEAGTSVKIAGYPMEIVQTQDRVVKVIRIFPSLEIGQ